jgi:hypothetical protein
VNLSFFAPWLPWQRPPFSTPQRLQHTTMDIRIFLLSFMKFDERNQNKILIPHFCFHGNCGKTCPTDSNFVGLSCSTKCGCCSYQVSSISVW